MGEKHEEQVKKVKNVIRILASQWLLTEHFDKETNQAVRKFADWLDSVMNENEKTE